MRILNFNESNKFQEMKSIMDDVNNILVELKDINVPINIEPSNDIRVKMASIRDGHFYINFLGLSEPWPKMMNIYPSIFEKIHMLIEYLEEKGFYTEISSKTYSSQSYERAITIEELESNLVEIPAYRLSYITLKFFHNDLNESLPNQRSVDQLERVMKISAKTDIGNRISDMNKQGANIHYMQNPIETGIESREEYDKHNKSFRPSWNLKHFCREEKEEKEVMNYLKSYKIFEKNESGLMDCLVELFDYGFELEHVEEGKPTITFLEITQQLLRIKLFKIFPKSVGQFSNYLEGEFDKDSFGPGDKNPKSREYMISNMHIEDEIIELVDEASHKIINSYVPATRGKYIINEYISSMDNTNVVVILTFFK